MISQTGGSSGLYGTIWIIENRQDIGRCPAFLYKENHALDAWFNKAYGGEQKSLLRL